MICRRQPADTTPAAAPSAETSFAIETFGLTRRFGDLIALDHLDLHNPLRRRFLRPPGPNGAGKSTTIKMLTTMLEPTSGTATVAGFDIVKLPRRSAEESATCRKCFPPTAPDRLGKSRPLRQALRHPPRRAQARIEEALRFMGLTDSANKLVKTYSGGMIRRLEIAQAMLHRPAVLFLDEPTVGLDPVARRTVWERLLELRARYQMTVLITTHGMDEADELCDSWPSCISAKWPPSAIPPN